MIKTEGEDVVINKYMLIMLITMLGGGGVFTGYATKAEAGSITKSEISDIINVELRLIQAQISRIDIKTEGVTVLLKEHSRRLDNLER